MPGWSSPASRTGFRQRIAPLVYDDAFMPQDGDSVFSLTRGVWRDWYLNGSKADGFSVAPLPVLSLRATPHPPATLAQGIRLTGALDQVPRREYAYLANFENTPFTSDLRAPAGRTRRGTSGRCRSGTTSWPTSWPTPRVTSARSSSTPPDHPVR